MFIHYKINYPKQAKAKLVKTKSCNIIIYSVILLNCGRYENFLCDSLAEMQAFLILSAVCYSFSLHVKAPTCDDKPFSSYPYCNPQLDLNSRVSDLVQRMNLDEKAKSMDAGIPAIPRLGIPSLHSGEALHGAVVGCLNEKCATSFPCPMALSATFDDSLWEEIGLAIGLESRAFYNLNAGAIWNFAPNINPGKSYLRPCSSCDYGLLQKCIFIA